MSRLDLHEPAASQEMAMQDPEPYYFLRRADGRDFLASNGQQQFSLVNERRHADLICAHMAPVVRQLAEKLTGHRYRTVLAGYFLPSQIIPDDRMLS